MAFVHLRDRWTRQPPGPVQVDWSNPLTRGLVFAYIASGCADVVRSRRISGGGALRAGRGGVGWEVAGASSIGAFTSDGDTNLGVGADFSVFAFVRQRAQSGTWRGIVSKRDALTSTGSWTFGIDSSNVLHWRYNGNTNVLNLGSTPTDASERVYGAVRRGGWVYGYVDGRESGSAGTSETSAGNTSTLRIGVGRNDATTENLLADFYAVLIWNGRGHTDGAVKELSATPYQLFRATRRVYYSLPTTGIPVLSAATVTNITANSATPRVTITF